MPASRLRGTVLIVSLLFSAAIAISIASFLRVATTASQISYRTYYLGTAMNIAESGLERAIWSINLARSDPADAWSEDRLWKYDASTQSAKATFDFGTLSGGATAQVKVHAQERIGAAQPFIVARSIITPPNGGVPIEKWILVTLRQRSLFSIGALGRDGVTFKGNNTGAKSWNSDPDGDPSTPYLPYSDSLQNDNASVATTSTASTIAGGNADIYGSAAVGTDDLDDIIVGPQGLIGPFGTANNVKDPASISSDFTADLPDVEAPAATYTALGAVSSDLTLPRVGDTPNADGRYYYSSTGISLNGDTLAISPGANVVIHVDTMFDALDIKGGSAEIKVGGAIYTNVVTGEVTHIPSTLQIYTPGNISVSGQGASNTIDLVDYKPGTSVTTTIVTTTSTSPVGAVYGNGKYKNTVIGWTMSETITRVTTLGTNPPATTTSTRTYIVAETSAPASTSVTDTQNYITAEPAVYTTTGSQAGQPASFQIYGTRTTEQASASNSGPQSFTISGNGNLSGVVYAPNADISAKGGGNSGYIYGALVGKTLTFTGNDSFFYDESLSDLFGDNAFGIESWTEFVSYADRATYASLMDF